MSYTFYEGMHTGARRTMKLSLVAAVVLLGSPCFAEEEFRTPKYSELAAQVALLDEVEPGLRKEMAPLMKRHESVRVFMANRSDPVDLRTRQFIFRDALWAAAVELDFDEQKLRKQYPHLISVVPFTAVFRVSEKRRGLLYYRPSIELRVDYQAQVSSRWHSYALMMPQGCDRIQIVRSHGRDRVDMFYVHRGGMEIVSRVPKDGEWDRIREDLIPVPKDAYEPTVDVKVDALKGYSVTEISNGLYGNLYIMLKTTADRHGDKPQSLKVVASPRASWRWLDGTRSPKTFTIKIPQDLYNPKPAEYDVVCQTTRKSSLLPVIDGRQVAHGRIDVGSPDWP